MDDIWPAKKETVVTQGKLKLYYLTKDRASGVVTLYFINEELKFIQPKGMPVFPVLRLLHKYPYMMPQIQCDKGAIKHMLSGSDVMCQGLTSPGGKIDPSIKKEEPVVSPLL